MQTQRRPISRLLVVGAVVLGLAAGSYGIATAATGSGSSGSSGSSAAQSQQAAGTAPSAQNPWGAQRSDETLLTGSSLTSVRDAALARVPGATIVRVETDADGNAPYEAHMVKADGTPVTVYVDKQFKVVGVDSR